ncbi:MAG: alkaline phosphatase [Gemmatimonadales bacterium]|jgi:alkaline phosphatase D|nr:alkaline phosphatase [Gemmatimonadales bacterium]MBT5568397.1 alkaline phosphatase [Acidimicrobiaceae bacterium]
MSSRILTRRDFLGSTIAATGVWTAQPILGPPLVGAPAIITSQELRPAVPSGLQTGDVTDSRAIVWSRTDRPARMWVDWATNDRFEDERTVRGPAALEVGDYTAALDLHDLPSDEEIVYRVRFESLRHPGTWSAPEIGRFRTAPSLGASPVRPLRVVFTGDEVGQGWGIDVSRGGIRTFETMRNTEPDVFIHSGDIIYADQPLEPEVVLDDGTVWRNLMTDAKSKVAETLAEFRGNYAYNLLDENARRFNASVPMIAQWDDHEVMNNWFPGLRLDEDDRYTEKSVSLLAARATRALFDYVPLRQSPTDSERIYRSFSYGPLLEIFVVDLRSYRGINTPNKQSEPSRDTDFLGGAQLAWLKGALRESRALWKVIACDMPIGLVIGDFPRDGQGTFEAWANADDGAPLGREMELADLLSFMKREGIRNTVWVTADVHYAAAHHYAPERALFTDFDPFWEFVAGPMHAGTFGPNALDATFGPEVRFSSIAGGIEPNRSPSDGYQFFGTLDIDPRTRALTAGIHNVGGERLWQVELPPHEGD